MTFGSPLMLLGLVVIAAAIVAYVVAQRPRRAGREAFASPALAAAVTPRRPRWRRHVPMALYAVAAAALVVALAKPQTTVAVPVEQATVMLVTDQSKSMEALDIPPSRMEAAIAAANGFLDDAPEDLRVGAVAFNQRARLLQTPTTDRRAVREKISALQAQGGTATGEGLALGLAAARQPAKPGGEPPPAAIILLADGRASSGRDVLEVAREAGDAEVPVHTIALGTDQGNLPGGGTAGSDQKTLRQVAELSGGTFSTAADADQLAAVYENLGSQVTRRDEQREVTAAWAGGALLLILAGGAISLTTLGRLP